MTYFIEKERVREAERTKTIINKRRKKDTVEVTVNNSKATSNENMNAEDGDGYEDSTLSKDTTNVRFGNMNALLKEKEPKKYTCSLTQGDKAATLFFVGDYVVHTGTTKQGPRLGRVVKVLKKQSK